LYDADVESPPAAQTDDVWFLTEIGRRAAAEAERFNAIACTLSLYFLAYLRYCSRFGYFSYGPINIDVGVVEDIVDRTTPRRAPGDRPNHEWAEDFDFVEYSRRVVEEVRRSGRRRIDELHILLTFMRWPDGLPKRVFGELGVTPEQVEEFARSGNLAPATLEKLYSPEEAAAYLNIHVQTVRAWIRSGRLRARRLAGQRALRITASDLQSVLEPVAPGDV
jgi:excisionase family DNA binding protein